jgi:3-methyladenine DNA glycosylase/8-oxoguanine DNA glycosylase
MSLTPELILKARRHLGRRDAILKQVIKNVGPCTLQPTGVSFVILVRAIISQLISTKAAATIYARLQAACSDGQVTPATILELSEDALRAVGLSRTKARGLRDLAERVTTGVLPLDHLAELSDDEVTERLLPVHSVGRWTTEMFLIFALGRLDVLPVDDLGFRAGVREAYGLSELPARKVLVEMAEPWRPYRTVATWYFWRSRGGVPNSK